jgi:mannose-6-phosphate isomerase-like protein (cupin superfamily)
VRKRCRYDLAGNDRDRKARMSAYSKLNLMDLENSAQAKAAGVDARFARSHIDSEHLGVSHFRYPPNFKPKDGHSHREQEEVYVVLSGSGRARLNDDEFDIGPWDVVRVAPSTVRGFAAGPDGLEVLAVGSDRPEGGDGQPAKDWWPDA